MTDWDGTRVLVTGGEGFIGSHLSELLVRQGARVRVLAHYNPFGRLGWLDPAIHGEIEVVTGDVRDGERVYSAMEGSEVVFHLAALIGIPYSYVAPESYVQVNINGTYQVANAARRLGVERLVVTSTSETYGTARTVPITEDHPMQPQSPYSASKIGADMLALSFFHSFELPVTIARPFNVYGPRQSTRAVIPTILSQLHRGATEIRLGATTPTRDFTYVSDTAAGFLAVARCEQALGHAVNLGSGQEISIGELADLLIELTGSSAVVTTDDTRLRPSGSEVERLLSDSSRALQWTGWKPEVSLRDGLARTSDWVAAHLERIDTGSYAV